MVEYIINKDIVSYAYNKLNKTNIIKNLNPSKFGYDEKRIFEGYVGERIKPKPNYLCTVNSHKIDGIHKQKADYYIFLRIKNDYSLAWILGWYSCEDFFNAGTFVPKGKDFGKFKFIKANATVLEIDKLNKF